MADLFQFREEPEEPLDCLYILQCSGSNPIDSLELSAKERRSLKQKAKALAPRGEECELISGECPVSLAHRLTFVGLGDAAALTHSKLRAALGRVMGDDQMYSATGRRAVWLVAFGPARGLGA